MTITNTCPNKIILGHFCIYDKFKIMSYLIRKNVIVARKNVIVARKNVISNS